jgi:hypothetical protein
MVGFSGLALSRTRKANRTYSADHTPVKTKAYYVLTFDLDHSVEADHHWKNGSIQPSGDWI